MPEYIFPSIFASILFIEQDIIIHYTKRFIQIIIKIDYLLLFQKLAISNLGLSIFYLKNQCLLIQIL